MSRTGAVACVAALRIRLGRLTFAEAVTSEVRVWPIMPPVQFASRSPCSSVDASRRRVGVDAALTAQVSSGVPMINVRAFEVELALATVTLAVPEAITKPAETMAVGCDELTKPVVRVRPVH